MRVSIMGGLAWGGLVAAVAACSAAEPDSAAVSRLVQQLNAASATARDQAERSLLELGPEILSQVVAARSIAAGEAAFRLQCLQHHFEERATAERVDAAIDTLTFDVKTVEAVAGGRRVRIALRTTWAPPLEPLAMRLPTHTIMADGPAGESLPPPQRQAMVEPALVPGVTSATLPVMLSQIDPPLESLATLRGTLTLWLAGRDHAFEIPLSGSPRSLRVGHATVKLVDAVIQRDRLEVTATITFDQPTEALASHRPWLTSHLIDVVGHDGVPLPRSEQRTAARSEQGMTAVASFTVPVEVAPSGLEGLRLRWHLPMAVHEVPVDFSVHNVPLPPAGT